MEPEYIHYSKDPLIEVYDVEQQHGIMAGIVRVDVSGESEQYWR